jgi:hypothetical protein
MKVFFELKCFCRRVSAIVFFFLGLNQIASASQVDIGIFESPTPNKIEIRIRPDFTIASNLPFTGILYTLRWSDPTIVITSLDEIYPFDIDFDGAVIFEDGYYHQKFFSVNPGPPGTAIPANSERLISSFSYTGNAGAYFELIENEWTLENNGGPSIEILGTEYYGIIYHAFAPTPCSLSLTCPGNISVPPDAGNCGAMVTYSAPVVSGDCEGVTVTQTAGLPSGSLFPAGTTINSFLAISSEGPTANCSFTVTVNSLPGQAGTITGTSSVCQGSSGVAYSVAPITNATSYVWTYSGNGATIIGSGNAITINFSTTATSGNLKVYGVNSCGNGPVSPNFPINVISLPGAAGPILGTTPVCQGQNNAAYSVAPIANATSYHWSYSGTGATINGSGSSVTINFSTTATSGNLTAYGSNGCGNGSVSPNYAITVNPLPGPAGAITGTTPVCQGQSNVAYSVAAIPHATSYVWSYSGTGATINGNGASVTISFSLSATSGNLTVKGVNSCGNGPVSPNYAITVNPLPGPAGTITGTATVCQGQNNVMYSVPPISNATSYAWSYSGTGATINGSGPSVTINFSGSATSGNLTVYGVNTCGNGAASPNYPITVNSLPGPAGTITGSPTVCQGQNNVTYSVAAIPNATSYVWNYSGTGAAINGSGASVTISFNTSATSGNVTVYGVNNCGNGAVSPNYAVTVNPLPGPAGTISGTASVCQGQNNVAYSVATIPNAASYVWTYSGTGATINGSGASVTVSYSASATSGNLTVHGVNSCGNGAVSPNYAITVNPLPGPAGTITGTATVCQNQNNVIYSVPPIPNATSYVWTYSGTGATINGTGPSVTVNFSGSATSGNLKVYGANSCGNGATSPNYPITVNILPGTAGTITGNTPVCQGQSNVAYSVAAIPNATSYAWGYSGTGATIYGNGASVTISYSLSATSGNLTVHGVNSCGEGAASPDFPIAVQTTPSAPVSGGNKSICINQIIPPLTVTVGAGETADWYASSAGGTSLATGTLSYVPPAAGTYYAEARNIVAGCLSATRTAVILTIHPLPVVYAGADQSIPNGTSTTITDATASGTATLSYSWTPAASFVNPSVLNPTTVNLFSTHIYTLTVTDGNSCSNTDQMTITITGGVLGADPDAVPAALCAGQTTQLYTNASGGSGTYTYSWTSIPEGFTSTQADPAAIPSETTIYTVVVNDGFNTVIDNVQVIVYPLPASPVSGGNQAICADEAIPPLTVTVGSGETADWYTTATIGTPVALGTLTFTPNTAGTFYSEARNLATGCLSATRTGMTLTVHSLPAVFAGADQSIPYGTSTTINDATAAGAETLSYAWTPAVSFVNPAILHPTTINLTSTGTYTLTVTDGNSCVNSDQVTITVTGGALTANPTATPSLICFGETTQLSANASGGSGTYSYSWTSAPVGFSSAQANPQASPTVTTTYSVTVNDGYNNASGNVTVTVDLVEVTCPGDMEASLDDPAFPLTGGLPEGGTYTGTGVTGGVFDPAAAGVGEHTITYTYEDENGCMDTCTFQITVSDEEGNPGDANCDGVVNVLDIITITNYIMLLDPSPFCFDEADTNDDLVINVLDIIGTVNIILSP